MKKIGLFIDTFHPGGAERVCINYANLLVNNNYSVTIIVYNKNKKFYLDELDSRVTIISLDCKNGIETLFKFIKTKNKNNYFYELDLLIAFNHQIALILQILKFFRKINQKIIARNVNNLSFDLKSNNSSYIKKFITNLLMKVIYNKVGCYIAQCESMKKDMINNFNIPQENITVIKNPTSIIFRKNNNMKKNDLLFVGRLKKQKGIDNLILILDKLNNEKISIKIKIIGKGELKEELLQALDNMKYIEYSYHDEIPPRELVRHYNESKITILTSYYEGYPNVLVESLASGTPIISFDCKSGPSEIIKNNKNGFLIPCYDCIEFSQKIKQMLLHPLEITDISCNEESLKRLTNLLENKND
ncbi:TPA: glycosyltransferase [Proteus mirabilis]|uniref:Gt4 n=1 Tax=Proteus mirabilis TaxID=584 RepID=A0A385JP86_PROMI|nr:glycosyltransferase [Proteus mirabilis]AXZ00115.1 gt4 [Proteus mirabilis]EKU0926709.1 glycosyltransferase [Proteus mirabilis]EKW0401264.1 glycosyltransferase [Proteus mirabilis]EKW4513116.1 glycosyltransferase [Proteus mirabilis]MDM3571185.1 glycosyltransferase [Proteus mirabilis]